jgi:hypothetical protein
MSEAKRISAVVGEHLFLLLALALIIPPVPSEKGQSYDYIRAAPLVAILAVASRWCAWLVDREGWLGLLVKPAMFVAAGYFVYLRASY